MDLTELNFRIERDNQNKLIIHNDDSELHFGISEESYGKLAEYIEEDMLLLSCIPKHKRDIFYKVHYPELHTEANQIIYGNAKMCFYWCIHSYDDYMLERMKRNRTILTT